MPNAGPAPFDWAHRSKVGNDNGYRYSLFGIFDEVLKYSGAPGAWSGHGIVIAPGRSPAPSYGYELFKLLSQESKLILKL
ncbi:Uncharacterized protein DBV15_03005 [Temnothorax longispinosus]|uniref:Uncharacterized protein n=1 Tax=Temnothorax longispinosus TaxID=300112 RepID=A0A4S2KCL6_9HYME|nr:Uncharacterized protein DBV15_03005 [Temnothorax longispinosus]